MKKIISILALALAVIFSLTACDGNKPENNPPEHVHSFGEWETKKPAACTEDGAKHRECSLCGEKESEAIPAIGHTEVIDAAVEATCTESGLTEGKHCSVCDEVLVAQDVLPITLHQYDDEYDESCNNCGFIRDTDCTHINTVVIEGYAPTCTKAGLTNGEKCEKCQELLVAQTIIDALGHNYVNNTCQRCGEFEYMAGIYDANDNLIASWDELVNTYGMDVSKDYTHDNYKTSPSSPYYVLKDKTELSSGVKIVIPGSVTGIGNLAFRDCDSLTSITIGNSVTSIGVNAFFGCKSLTSITIPDGVTGIGNCAFYGCQKLTSITIGNSVTSIGNSAFEDCDSLTSITIPDSVTSIGDGAFCYCNSLTDVYYTGSEAEWANISIRSYNSDLEDANIHFNYIPE